MSSRVSIGGIGAILDLGEDKSTQIYRNLTSDMIFTTVSAPRLVISANGNLLVGTITESSVDNNSEIALPDARLYVRGAKTAAATTDIIFRGGLEGNNNGKVKIWLANDASYSSYIQSEHTGGGNTQLTFGTANGSNVLPDERMRIGNNGNITIGGSVTAASFFGDGRGLTGLLLTSNDTNLSNYVLSTSNLLATRINAEMVFGSNYSDKVGVWGSNYAKDKIGIYSSNYSDKVSVWGSNYARDNIGIYSSNYSDKVGVWGSNYARDTIGVYSSNYSDKVGGWGSNYSDNVGVWGSNYAKDKIGIYSSNYSDKVGVWGSNYARDNIGIYSSNYSDKVGVWTSNYARDNIGIYSSNYSDKVGVWGSNYARDNIGIYSSNYTDKVGGWGSNYARDNIGIYSSNYSDKVGVGGSNYVARLDANASNYVLSTSNILVNKIGSVSSQWTISNTSIYYNSNVGIGTSFPNTKLHLYDNIESETKLIIQNDNVKPTEIVIAGTTSTTIGTADRMIQFHYSGSAPFKDYSFTPAENLVCDILVVGGGGGGGKFGGGGGSGAILFSYNFKLSVGNPVLIKVGKGGLGETSNYSAINGINGEDSSITINSAEYIAKGGGGGATGGNDNPIYIGRNGNAGGSGGGGSHANNAPRGLGGTTNNVSYSNFQSFGNNGGFGKLGLGNTFVSGGGGGAGGVGVNFSTTPGVCNGGPGKEFISYFGANVGVQGWFAGGGGGNTYATENIGNRGFGGQGGGGNGALGGFLFLSVEDGKPNTGGGGGGDDYDGNGGGDGGSGIVILRYRKEPLSTPTSASLELIINSAIAGDTDYSVGNYGGDFKIISSTSGINTDALVISQNSNVAVGGNITAKTFFGDGSELTGLLSYTTEAKVCNYILSTSNILVDRTMKEVDFGSNYIVSTSNRLINRITNLVTDDITETINSKNKYIVNDRYNNNLLVNGTLTINSNLIVLGDDTRLETIVYTTERLEIVNENTATVALKIQQKDIYTDIFNASNSNAIVFNIANNGDVNISGKYKINNRDIDDNASNYVLSSSNLLANRIGNEVSFGSNNVLTTSNSLVDRINSEVDFGSNYVFSSSNALVSLIMSGVSSQWVTSNTGIYYNSNVGIGTTNPLNKLHIYDDIANNTKLIIQNNTNIVATAPPTEIVVSGATSTTIGTTDRMLVFPYSGSGDFEDYSFTPTENLICDILIVGGGGGGSAGQGGGGGAGQLVLIHQATLNSGSYIIKVGKGGIGGVTVGGIYTGASAFYPPTKGIDSSFDYVIAEGGGANTNNVIDKDGGSGAGGDGYTMLQSGGEGTSGFGNKNTTLDSYIGATVYSRGNNGGNQGTSGGWGGGGGGAGQAGVAGGPGGDGLSGIVEIGFDFKNKFGTSVGKLESDGFVWFAGGGGSGGGSGGGFPGGLGGGGLGKVEWDSVAESGVNGTGSGGGGGAGFYGDGGNGGSGIVIIRYSSAPSKSSASIELIQGTSADSNTDYKLGNYSGDFKIMTSTSNVDINSLLINSKGDMTLSSNLIIQGRIGIGTPSPSSKLEVYGGDIRLNTNWVAGAAMNVLGINTDRRLEFSFNNGTSLYDTNKIRFLTGSSLLERMVIDASGNTTISGNTGVSGNVGVGTVTPTSRLEVYGGDIKLNTNWVAGAVLNMMAVNTDRRLEFSFNDGTALYDNNRLRFFTANNQRMTIATGGNVGIGTTNPSQRVHIVHPSNNLVRIETDTSAASQVSGIEFGIPSYSSATRSKITSTTYTGDGSDLQFYTSSSTSSSTARMMITSNGFIGIGTSAPSQRLHVVHPSNGLVRIETDTNAISQVSGIEFGIPSYSSATRSKITSTTYTGDASDLQFYTSSSTMSATARMMITSNGNVGIGTSPENILHINDASTSNTKFKIQNNYIVNFDYLIPQIPNEIVVTGTTTTTIGTFDKCISFPYTTDTTGTGQTQYTFTTTQDLLWDVLVIGGGGGGARRMGGGGGAGTLIYDSNVLFTAGTYTLKVGRGGTGSSTSGNIDNSSRLSIKRGENGVASEIFRNTNDIYYRAVGGGGGLGGNTDYAVPSSFKPLPGGSGGGNGGKDGAFGGLLSTLNIVRGVQVNVLNNIESSGVSPSYDSSVCFGNEGGIGGGDNPWMGSGGGGAGSRGTDVNLLGAPTANNTTGVGGSGKIINITGSNIPYAGGGGGGFWDEYNNSPYYNDGGLGGGGRSGTNTLAPVAGINGTGGGGGSDGQDLFGGANGGSGIVIIRYRMPPYYKGTSALSSASIELTRGLPGDANTDYKIGNYAGDFKIMSSTSNVDTNRLLLTSNGDITVSGSINAATKYLLDGRNILEDTSNYVLSTNNIISERIFHMNNDIVAMNTNTATNIIRDTSAKVTLLCNTMLAIGNLNSRSLHNTVNNFTDNTTSKFTMLCNTMLAIGKANDNNISNYIFATSNKILSAVNANSAINATANNLEVNGNLTVNSNLIVLGDSTRLETTVYTTERMEIVNANSTTTALMVQQNTANRDIFVASNMSATVFKIANNGDVNMNGSLTATNITGALNMANATSGTLAIARGGTGATTFTAGQVLIGNTTTSLLQTANLTWDIANSRLGIGTATPITKLHVVGEIIATDNIISYYSDERLKTKLGDINEPLKIINKLNGFYYIPNELARINGITNTDKEIGLSAQDVQKVLPEIVQIAPFDLATDDEGKKISKSGENYLTMSYERLAPVFVEAIKELEQKNNVLEQRNAVLEQKNIVLTDKYNTLLEDITMIKKKLLIEPQ